MLGLLIQARPGAIEVDLVEHNGGRSGGHDAATLSMVDVASGWSCRRAVLGKSQAVVDEALQRLLGDWPTEVWALHSDNGGEFLNAHLVRFRRQRRIEFHRSRAYRKNDNAHVEQKNRQWVREVVGYARYNTASDVLWLNSVRLDDPPPGLFAQIDFGRLGLVPDGEGRRRLLWGLSVVLMQSASVLARDVLAAARGPHRGPRGRLGLLRGVSHRW